MPWIAVLIALASLILTGLLPFLGFREVGSFTLRRRLLSDMERDIASWSSMPDGKQKSRLGYRVKARAVYLRRLDQVPLRGPEAKWRERRSLAPMYFILMLAIPLSVLIALPEEVWDDIEAAWTSGALSVFWLVTALVRVVVVAAAVACYPLFVAQLFRADRLNPWGSWRGRRPRGNRWQGRRRGGRAITDVPWQGRLRWTRQVVADTPKPQDWKRRMRKLRPELMNARRRAPLAVGLLAVFFYATDVGTIYGAIHS